jgi:hypothetical protein
MLMATIIVSASAIGTGLILLLACRAPDGYEDIDGFHSGSPEAGGWKSEDVFENPDRWAKNASSHSAWRGRAA